jgi:carboxyl-terminal processing protease
LCLRVAAHPRQRIARALNIQRMHRARLTVLLAVVFLLNGVIGVSHHAGLTADPTAPTPVAPSPPADASAPGADDSFQYTLLFSRVMQLVRQNYVDPKKVGYKELTYAALKGMLASLDPHSQFLDEEAFADLQRETRGGPFSGLGIIVGAKDNAIVIVEPMEDSPAGRAGLMPGDRIMKINGKSTEKMSLATVGDLLKGAVGEKASLTILRPSDAKPNDGDVFEVNLTREVIQVTSVKDPHLLPAKIAGTDKVGYVRIEEFGQQTPEELVQALNGLEKAGMNSLVIDLRNNPGGLLEAAVEVAGGFVRPNTVIVSIKGRSPAQDEDFSAKTTRPRPTYPIALLINGYSASAAEIVAGALKDLKRALLVGETTFGKGSVQTVQPLGNGIGLRLTTAKYYTPSNRVIHEVGITPDLAVPITDAEDRAIILAEAKRALSPEEKIEVAGMEDRQLERAVSALRSWGAYRERQSVLPPGGQKTEGTDKSTDATTVPDVSSH